MKKSELRKMIKEEIQKLNENKIGNPGSIITATTDGIHGKKVKVKLLDPIKLSSDFGNFKLQWVEYPKGYLDIVSSDPNEKELYVDHDTPMAEMIEKSESYVKKIADQYGLKIRR